MTASRHDTLTRVTDRLIARSQATRRRYLDLIERAREVGIDRSRLGCSNLAHGFAASFEDKAAIRGLQGPNIGIVTAYNDMLSAHQPYGRYPEQIKLAAREVGATAQVAGGVAAMCDGVTQGMPGMDLSLFSRDTIALSTAVALSHGMFEGALLLGICDKIIPGLLMGALRFGHLAILPVPGGPMPSGLSNPEKARIRQLHVEGKATTEELLDAESGAYHTAGTCTFYGTANTNQVMMEAMGLHVPGAAFVNPGTRLRTALTRAATHRVAAITWMGQDYRPLGRLVDERAIVNACVALLATGGSTNHALHIPAIARAAGIQLDWDDLSELSRAVPLLVKVYPNGPGDVNRFQVAGGPMYVIRELLGAGLLHDLPTVWEGGLAAYTRAPDLEGDALVWRDVPAASGDESLLRPMAHPFAPDGGMALLAGNLGRATLKVSAVDPSRHTIEAPARVFHDQESVQRAFRAGELTGDVVCVVRFQGPRANGMPELHKLTPVLGVLQDRGARVALVTDGRMSGASGKVPAAIHVTPEALGGGPLAKLRDGDVVRVCAQTGVLAALVDAGEWAARPLAEPPPPALGTGRELFALFREAAGPAEAGASPLLAAMEAQAMAGDLAAPVAAGEAG